jgi:hypothetical protein
MLNELGPYFSIETNGLIPKSDIHPLDDIEVSSKKIKPLKLSWINKLVQKGLNSGLFECLIKKYEKGKIERADITYMGEYLFRLSWDNRTKDYRCIDWQVVTLCNALESCSISLVCIRWIDDYEEILFKKSEPGF